MKARIILSLLFWMLISACGVNKETPQATPPALPGTPTLAPTPIPNPQPTLQVTKVTFPSCQASQIPSSTSTLPEFPALPLPNASAHSLRSLAEARGLTFGAALDPNLLNVPGRAEILAREFNTLAVSNAMKWESIHPEPDRYDFSQADVLIAFAWSHNMKVYGHVLVWELQQPAWLTGGQHTREEWINILCTHIKTVVGYYRGQVYAWDVVNEALNSDGTLRDTHWLRAIGPQYIPMAFQWAHEADPGALLIYNDFFAEGMNQKSDAVYGLVKGLLQMGAPVDGVGLQMHVWLDGPPTAQDLAANMQRLAALGLKVHITEMDVRTQYSSQSHAEKMIYQAETYRQALATCLNAPNCDVFVTWGLTDADSWIPHHTGNPDFPLLFDEQGQPKPAYYALLDLLSEP